MDDDGEQPPADEIARIQSKIGGECDVAMGNAATVTQLCDELYACLTDLPALTRTVRLAETARLLRNRKSTASAALFSFLEEQLEGYEEPWPILREMLCAHDAELAIRALGLLTRLIRGGKLGIGSDIIESIAERFETSSNPFEDSSALIEISRLYSVDGSDADFEQWRRLYLDFENLPMRRLAARVLDANGCFPSESEESFLLSEKDYPALKPYLDYTRISHLDLLHVAGSLADGSTLPEDLARVERQCGALRLKTVLSLLGWPQVCSGLAMEQQIGVSVGGGFPLALNPDAAKLFESCGSVERVYESQLFIAHGHAHATLSSGEQSSAQIERFRRFNLLHAELLDLLLRPELPTSERARHILDLMQSVVDDFVALFSALSEECRALPAVFAGLRGRAAAELNQTSEQALLSPHLTHLLFAFEDPASLDSVKTIHGLKRYLHQRGLHLGFQLGGAGAKPSHTLSLVAIDEQDQISQGPRIRFTSFGSETGEDSRSDALPYSVRLVAHTFGEMLIRGQKSFPSVDILCYGNETYFYLLYRNHPALLRVDLSPPLRGGMADLKYYGVSKYDLTQHPNLELQAIRALFTRIGFDIAIEGTRVHARCDKEKILDLSALCERIEMLFHLAPYFMELDWVIGSLALPEDTKQKVIAAWAEIFSADGLLPFDKLLTSDRLSIAASRTRDALGPAEFRWDGEGEYKDSFCVEVPPRFVERMNEKLADLSLNKERLSASSGPRSLGQNFLNKSVLHPLETALRRGEVLSGSNGLVRPLTRVFERECEVERFARILADGEEAVARAIAVARLISPLERGLKFSACGSLNGWTVVHAVLPFPDSQISLYQLCDSHGNSRLAFASQGEALFRHRESEYDPWQSLYRTDAQALAILLRNSRYLFSGRDVSESDLQGEAREILEHIRGEIASVTPTPIRGEQRLTGIGASPGRVTGPVVFYSETLTPPEVAGCVLVTPSLHPHDAPLLFKCSGIITTSGAALSHVGLMALQFGKPSLIIEGIWRKAKDGRPQVHCDYLDFEIERRSFLGFQLEVQSNARRAQCVLEEGDLIVLDATHSRAVVLGRERDARDLFETLRTLEDTCGQMRGEIALEERLATRGRVLRAHYHTSKILERLTSASVGRFAVEELLRSAMSEHARMSPDKHSELIRALLTNRVVGADARSYAENLVSRIQGELTVARYRALAHIPSLTSLYEILCLRLDILKKDAVVSAAGELLGNGRNDGAGEQADLRAGLDRLTRERLEQRHEQLRQLVISSAKRSEEHCHQIHNIEQLRTIERLLGAGEPLPVLQAAVKKLGSVCSMTDQCCREGHVLRSTDCCLAHAGSVGWKAANLAEIGRICGGEIVPAWFVITDRAFQEVVWTPWAVLAPGNSAAIHSRRSFRETIETVMANDSLQVGQKSRIIRSLWDGITLPRELHDAIIQGYREIAGSGAKGASLPFVALRSSGHEEDTAGAARAGEFESYLFVKGEEPFIEHLKRTWSSLWTERAIHNRMALGLEDAPMGGGVIVQRMVASRLSGVVFTINVTKSEPGEMLINVGYGLGEGIVSGYVSADQVSIEKQGLADAARLRFHYVTADKQHQVVFDDRSGAGTRVVETLFHQRWKPAMEYSELAELASIALKLEEGYAQPLDIEFAFEGPALRILQARPVAEFDAVLRETLTNYPLAEKRSGGR